MIAKSVLPVELLRYWKIEPEDLDQRARDLILYKILIVFYL